MPSDPSQLPSSPAPILGPAAGCIANGQEWGTVNGQVVCVSPGPTTKTTQTSTASQQVTRPDGSTGTVNTTTTSVCTGAGACTSTTTTTVAGGGKTGTDPNGTTTTTTNGDKNGVCKEDPKAAGCGDVPKFVLPKPGKFNSKQTDIEAAQQQLTNQVNTIKGQIASMFGSLSTGGGGLACGQGVQIPQLGINFNLCFSPYEQKLGPIQAAVMFIATLAALFIIFA